MRSVLFLFFSLALLSVGMAQNGTEPVKITDMLKIKTAGNISIKKDGSAAVFSVTSIIPDEKNKLDYKYETQLYRVNADGNGAPFQVTYAKEGSSQAAWSPDGKQLAFVRTVEEKPQIFLLSMDGGEPFQLTKFTSGAANPKWSVDGNQLMFSSLVPFQTLIKENVANKSISIPAWPYEKPGFKGNENLSFDSTKGNPDGNTFEIRNYLQNNEADKKAIVLNKLNFQNEMGISSEMNFNQFYFINATAGATPVPVIRGFNRYSNVDFTPDGKHLVISGDVDSLESPDRSLENEIFIADADGSNIKMLLGAKGKSYTNATVSSTGRWVAFVYGPTSFVSVPTLAIMPLIGTEKDIVNIVFDRNINTMKWSTDDHYLYFSGPSNWGSAVVSLKYFNQKSRTAF